MALFDDMFKFYEKEFGKEVIINDSETANIAYIQDLSLRSSFFNDKLIFCEHEIKTGDVITYDNEKWIVISQSDKYKTYNVATMRQADFVTKFVFYGSVYESPCIYMNQSITSKNNQVSLTDSKTVCVLPHFGWVDNIKVDDKFIQFGYYWKVTGFDFTKEGLVYVHAERDKEADYESIQLGYDKGSILYDWVIKWTKLPSTAVAGHSYPIEAKLIKIFADGHTVEATEPFYYETSDKDVAIISENELIAKKSGRVTLKAIFSKDLTKILERDVEIYPSSDVLNLVFDPFPDVMFTEDKATIHAKLYKNGVLEPEAVISYYIPDNYNDIAEMDELHKITALKTGQFFVFASYKDPYNELTISKAVTIQQSIYTIAFETQSRLYQIHSQRSCKAVVYRNNVIDLEKPIVYESSNLEVASISQDGVVSAETLGSAIITASLLANRDVKISKPIEVVTDAYEVIWDKYLSGRLYLDKTYKCHAIITKNYEPVPVGEGLEVGYFSSDDRIVKVDNEGNVTVLKEGKATITAYIKTKETIKATSDVYIDKAFFEIKIVSKATNTEDEFNEKKLYWKPDTNKDVISKEAWDKYGVGIWKSFNIVITRDGDIITPNYLAKDCVKIYVDGRDYTSAYFNEADLMHPRAYKYHNESGWNYKSYNYKEDRLRQTMKLNEFNFNPYDSYHVYKIVANIPDHEDIKPVEIEWSLLPFGSKRYITAPEDSNNIRYKDENGEWKTTEIQYPFSGGGREYNGGVSDSFRILNNTVDRVEIEQFQLASDNISMVSFDKYNAIIKRDKDEAWRYGEWGYGVLNKPDVDRFETKTFHGGSIYLHDRNGMLTDSNYYTAEQFQDGYDSYNNPKFYVGDFKVSKVPSHMVGWLNKYRKYVPYNKVSTNDDTVIGAEFTQTNWNYLRGVGIGSAIITTEFGLLKEKEIVQAVTRFQTVASCVRTTGLGIYLTSNKIIPCHRLMGIGSYSTLNSVLLPSEDMVFEVYDNGGNDVELFNVPLIHEGGLLENGEQRKIPFRDGWREDPVYSARNPFEITKVTNTSPYVDIDKNGDIKWNYSMRFIYIKNDKPVGDVFIKAYNKNYPNNYVIRRLYVSEYLSPLGRLTMWLGYKKDNSDELPRYGIAKLSPNWNPQADYISTGSVGISADHDYLTCETRQQWRRDIDAMPKYNYPYDYRYMSIFLYDQSQPNNLIKPEDKYDIGFWRWGFDYNGYGGYTSYTGDGDGVTIYNNQIVIDLRSWFRYLQIWQPFYIILQNYAMGMDGYLSSLSNYNYMDDSTFDYSEPTSNYVLGTATRSEVIRTGFEGTLDEAMKNLAMSKAFNEYGRKYSTSGNDAYQWSTIGYTKLWFENLPEPTYKYLMIINNTPTPFNLHQWYLSLYADWFNQKNGDYNYYYGAGAVGYPETYDYSKSHYDSPLDIIATRRFRVDPNNLFEQAYNKYVSTAFAIKHVSAHEVIGLGTGNQEYIGGYVIADESDVITPF